MSALYIKRVGWFASIMGVVMFTSFLDQIRLNLGGSPGSVVLPIATVINCAAWVTYGYLQRPKRDWPIMFCNSIGVIIGSVTAVTAIQL